MEYADWGKEGAAHYFIDDRSQDTILLEDELDLESMKKEDLITYINQIIAQYKDQTTVLFEKKPTKKKPLILSKNQKKRLYLSLL